MYSAPRPILCVDALPVVPTYANSAEPSRSGGGVGAGVWPYATRDEALSSTSNKMRAARRAGRAVKRCIDIKNVSRPLFACWYPRPMGLSCSVIRGRRSCLRLHPLDFQPVHVVLE